MSDSAQIRRLTTAREKIDRQSAASARAAIADLPLTPNNQRIIAGALRAITMPEKTATIWPGATFTMISREATGKIWKAIDELDPKLKPHLVRKVFDQVLLNLEFETGMVVLSREEIAEAIGCASNHVSHAMGILHRMGVIETAFSKVPGLKGRVVTYYVNADVAWTGSLEMRAERAARQAQRSLRLVGGTDAPPTNKRRARAEPAPTPTFA